MAYPLKDKTKADKIKDDFDKEINDIEKGTKKYESEIKKLRNKPIPQTLKDKLKDDRFGKEHAFEEMPCNHESNSRFNIANCQRCKYNKREIEAENLIDSLTGTEESMQKNASGILTTMTLKRLIIDRGSMDDVRGYVWEWS